MSNRLAELSDDAAHEIRTALRESREGVLMAQKRIDILRKSPLVVNGTRASLETLRGKLGEAEELYITVFRQVSANYGDERAVGGRIMNKDQSGGHSSYTLENLSKLDIPISRGTLVDKMDATSNSS